jgi:uncharacterized protein
MPPMRDTLALLDWRRQVATLYAEVRHRREADPVGAQARWREARETLFADHPASPLGPERRPRFEGLPCWDYDPAFAFTADVEPADPERFELVTSGETPMAFVRVGVITVPIGTLDVFWLDAYAGGLFIPFRDATAGDRTYGAGRYLLDTAKSADLGVDGDGRLVCDFNFAYHPSCAADPRWACPLAPPGNRLEVAVEAGEQLPLVR